MRLATLSRGAALAACALLACSSGADETATIEPTALLERVDSGEKIVILDVRTPAEFESGHVPGARNVPHTELPARLSELRDAEGGDVVVYCERGGRASVAEAALREAGFENVLHLEGDMSGWRDRGLPCIGC